jgi:ferredoxin-type protein NapH
MNRQRLRKFLLLLSFLLFPVTIYYLSPVLIINAGLNGIINGSFVVFLILLVGSIFFGRIFCAYLCPAGGLQECAFCINERIPKQGWRNNIKYVIWTVWIAAVVVCYLYRGEIVRLDFFYETDHGISVANIYGYIIYYGIVFLILVPCVLFGKRVFCHYFCWIAPFMALGTKLRRLLHLPGLQVTAQKENCIACKRCNQACPMGLDVQHMAKQGGCTSTECIQCGACIDACSKHVLHYRMK